MNLSTLQEQIDDFIGKFGSLALIQYLHDFPKNNPEQDYPFLKRIVQATCEVYNVRNEQLRNMDVQKGNVVDARRQLVYICTVENQLPTNIVTEWFSCHKRTIYKYQSEAKERLIDKKFFAAFIDEHNCIKNKIDNGNTTK
jgi:hypothetical protein